MQLYLVFHLNLMFSAIREEQRSEIVERCYWPILDLAARGVPLGIELSGVTAEMIQSLDGSWTTRARQLMDQNSLELIGSGYSQSIGPLVPFEVNRRNLGLGNDVYREAFGRVPRVGLVNEMAWSAGLAPAYLENVYEAVIVEWNNARRFQRWPKSREFSICSLAEKDGRRLDVIWADTLFFQQFQRAAHGQIEIGEFDAFLQRRCPGEAPDRPAAAYKSLYCSDAEVFNFRPGRFETEAVIEMDEWERIYQVVESISETNPGYEIALPSQILDSWKSQSVEPVVVGTPEQPISVKKQRKYNINRWALSGRDDLGINSRCHAALSGLTAPTANAVDEDWKELCYLWSSDFRTHITEERWGAYFARLDEFHQHWASPATTAAPADGSPPKPAEKDDCFTLEDSRQWAEIDARRGLTLTGFGKTDPDGTRQLPLLGLVSHGVFDDIELAADFHSGHAVIHRPANRVRTSLDYAPDCRVAVEGSEIVFSRKADWGNLDTRLSLSDEGLRFRRRMTLPQREPWIIRMFNFTFFAENWDTDSLRFGCHNGGPEIEWFPIEGHSICHSRFVSWLTSAEFGLGMTGGELVISDGRQSVTFSLPDGAARILPFVTFLTNDDGESFFRVEFSAQEIDETFRSHEHPVVCEAELLLNAA